MYRILLTRDGQVFDEPYLTKPPAWHQADEGDLEKLAKQAIEHLMMERNRRYNDSAPNGYQITDERGEIVKSERLF